ncbi:alpha-glucan family phosphorylase [Dehalobacterium formicoaceticum]|uniref:Alpha-glucan family phosphorylase n=1 Tax=Dehalobacterium formicoaceticum TaxID=51515 RepID=A0ABT1Y417_9FIRM|nr:alpha-glucan family phosphorylase [Dehalobacterium formicoaceticum]MCR6545617.1 alpha-glucan family phosphorylase [Dehalobacterium formicoaceticum]
MNQNNSNPQVAYFCMEFGLSEEMPIYAGGLGVLAGDYLKAAREAQFPMIGIGILWAHDYTEQYINGEGRPYDVYPEFDYPMVQDTGVSVHVNVRGEDVECKVKMVDCYGNVPLYLLDTNIPGSSHGWMTNKLYGGAAQDRLAAEMILGIGGIRLLRALGLEVDLYHFNEGHALFAGLELIREEMEKNDHRFDLAWKKAKSQIIFTTHTPVAAGNEIHDHNLLNYMGAYNGLNYEEMCQIGGDPFNMTAASLRLSFKANAVSKLHGHTARKMWQEIPLSTPIISITNGVHEGTWQDKRMKEAFDRSEDLFAVHMTCKKELFNYIAEKTGQVMDPEVLTLGFARRAAPYKRSDLIFRNSDLLEPFISHGKLQLIFSGKAHPNDQLGKDIIADLVKMDQKYGNRVVFLENYNMEVAKLLVRGCDVWLNNPRRPFEASGTSGIKAAMNGVLNFSVVDGWVAEGPQHGVSGWLLEQAARQSEVWDQDEKDLQELYQVLFREIMPTYYQDRERWKEMMLSSIDMAQWQFSSARMIREYYDVMYRPTFQALDYWEVAPYIYPGWLEIEHQPQITQ